MDFLEEKFQKLGAENAPGQEARQNTKEVHLRGEKIPVHRLIFHTVM